MPPSSLSGNAVFVLSSFMESMVYGITAVLFVESVQTLLRTRRRRDRLNIPLIIGAPILFFFVTLHIFGVWVRTYIAVVSYPEGPDAYWSLITTPEKTVTQTGQLGAILLGDAMTVYRAWMIYERRLPVIVVPLLTYIATCVCGITFVTIQHQVDVHTSIFQATVTRWTEAWLACSLCTTGICTGLIVWKLSRMQWYLRDSFDHGDGQVSAVTASSLSLTSRVNRILIESAALYSTVNLLYLSLYAASINVEAWFSGLDTPVASITFSMIIIRTERAAIVPTERYTTNNSITAYTGSSHEGSSGGRAAGKAKQHGNDKAEWAPMTRIVTLRSEVDSDEGRNDVSRSAAGTAV